MTWIEDRTTRGRTPVVDNALRTAVRLLGAVAAFAGAEHGVGELTQAPREDTGLFITSWPHVAAFEPLGGEPAMTILPDVRLAGVFTVLVSVSLAWWVARAKATRSDGWILLGFSTLLLVGGGGFGPPLVTVALGVALLCPVRSGARVAPLGAARGAVARRWRQLLVLTVAAFLALVPGVVLLAMAGIESGLLTATLPLVAFSGLLVTLTGARIHDHPGILPEGADRHARAGRL